MYTTRLLDLEDTHSEFWRRTLSVNITFVYKKTSLHPFNKPEETKPTETFNHSGK